MTTAPHRKIVILTGAGISAESGLGTFRDEGGLWARHRIEDVATPEGFARNPALVHDFYNARREAAAKADAGDPLVGLDLDDVEPGVVVDVQAVPNGLVPLPAIDLHPHVGYFHDALP